MIYLGIDVAKAMLEVAVWVPATRKYYDKRVRNNAAGITQLLTWACTKWRASAPECRVTLEATGVYHEVAAETLHDAGVTVVLANPKRVRDFAKGLGLLNKTDRVDARILARYGAEAEPRPWQPPALEVRQLRALLARLAAVEDDVQREHNRLEKARATVTPAVVLDSLQRTIAALTDERKRLLAAIDDHYHQHPGLKRERDLLQTIPAIGAKSSHQLLCLLRTKTFSSARQAAACAGLVPVVHQSGSSVRGRPRLSKQGNAKLRAVLYMAAVVALKHNSELRRVYQQLLARGKAKMAALGVLMRKLVHIAYGVLKHQCPYNPDMVSKIC